MPFVYSLSSCLITVLIIAFTASNESDSWQPRVVVDIVEAQPVNVKNTHHSTQILLFSHIQPIPYTIISIRF